MVKQYLSTIWLPQVCVNSLLLCLSIFKIIWGEMEILTKFRHVPYNFYLTSWYATFLFKAFITFNLTIIDFVVAS